MKGKEERKMKETTIMESNRKDRQTLGLGGLLVEGRKEKMRETPGAVGGTDPSLPSNL